MPRTSFLNDGAPPDLDTWILTELALLGLGQGLPAPGPLREGEMETIKAVLGTPQLEPAGAEEQADVSAKVPEAT